ncbi:MAG: diaminopropionate ammonia-lyase [Pseudomonadota bacterium]|nr:diaminopropionate ammonia-lyase [Pseudomonadota bacterium]
MGRSTVFDFQRALTLTRHCPEYQPTPLLKIKAPSGHQLLIKDETSRFRMGAFKALGGIYAMAAVLLARWREENQADIEPEQLFTEEMQNWSRQFTFVCASAGNHGLAVARGAQLFNAGCRIHLADTVPVAFENRLLALGVTVVRSGANYEQSMHAATADCANGEILLSDSAWEGYSQIPSLVMEGYTVIAEEMRAGFQAEGLWPTHVFLQAGVGGLAAAITSHIRSLWPHQPTITVVEPDAAACLMESHQRGILTEVNGPISSMGRLDCKLPSTLAFDILHRQADHFVCISDLAAKRAVQYLATHQLRTTPSGAAGVAAVLGAAGQNPDIPDNAICLALVTEAET